MKIIPDILLIGGGVIGLTTARELARQGASVTIIERGRVGQEASWAGAGMLPPGRPAGASTPEGRLRSLSATLWHDLSADLRERTGIDNGYRNCGSLEVATDDDSFHHLQDQVTAWEAEGIAVDSLSRRDLERHVPGLHESISSGVYLPDFCQVRNPRHLKALVAACQQLGVSIVENVEHVELIADGEGVDRVVTPSHTFQADRICVTAGAWSSHLLHPLNVQLPVKPVRGQIAQLRLPQLPFSCVVEVGRRYLVPRTDGLILAGATEEAAGFEKQNTSQGVSGLLQFAAQLVPELADAELVRCWAGLRPGSPDELPFLGPVAPFENLFLGAGHFRSGLQMSPGTAAILAALLLDQEPPINLDGLTCDRMETLWAQPE